MNIILCPTGSSGDVHPFIGLGLELQERGHHVTIVTSGYFREMIEGVGLECDPLGDEEEFVQLANHPDLWHPLRSFRYICREGILPGMRAQYDIIAQHYVQGETVLIGSCLGFGARIAQEALGVPFITVHLQPAVLWSNYESPVLPGVASSAPRWLKRFQFWLGETLFMDRIACKSTNAFRAELGLPPMKRIAHWWHSPQCVLCLFPSWYASIQPDWPPNVIQTHFPLWDERGTNGLSAEVEQFLVEGDKPIVFTPGSAMRFGQKFFAAAVEACRLLNLRAILLSRFQEHIPSQLPSTIRYYDFVPFGKLLPRAAALVHHGGIGSTAQGMAAGIPQLVMPMAHDQPDNAARLKRLGVGEWLRPSAFRATAVAEKLNRMLTCSEVQRSCQRVAAGFEGRNGLSEACEAIQRFSTRNV